MNKVYWLHTPWYKYSALIKRALELCNTDLIYLKDILRYENRIRRLISNSIRVIDLYLMDLYCFNAVNKPAFCISKNELSDIDNKILQTIRSSSYLLIETILSSLYGDINGNQQVDYLLKWINVNLAVFSNIWSNYNLPIKHSLSKCEIDLYKVRETYLRSLDLLNGKGNKIDTTTTLKLINNSSITNNTNLINSLLND